MGTESWGYGRQAADPPVVNRILGQDPAGAVTVLLDGDGLPDGIELDPDWRMLVGAEGLASAVGQAGRTAVEKLWQAHAAETDEWLRQATDALAQSRGGPLLPVHSTPLLEDDVLRAFEATMRLIERRERGPDSGTAGQGRLVLRLTEADVLVCDADPEWVAQQETAALAAGLATALASLRAEHAQTVRVREHATLTAARLAPESYGPPRSRSW